MGTIALTDCAAYVGGHDFTGDTNNLVLTADAAANDVTTFASGGWGESQGGLKSGKFDLSGFWQSATTDAVDPEAFPDLATLNRPVTFCVEETETSVAYLAQMGKFQYVLGGTIGDVAPFTLAAVTTEGQSGVARGQLAKAKGNVSATGVLGSVVNLGAPIAGQYVYAILHVFSAGTTITVQVQSDTASNFPSATTIATIGPITTAGGTWATRVAGPLVGETHYRLNVSAITGTFQVAGAIAVQ